MTVSDSKHFGQDWGRTWYEVLEVDRDASRAAIVTAYRRLADLFQPNDPAIAPLFDTNQVQSIRSELDQAFRTLSDPVTRAAYDRQLLAAED